MIKRSRIVVAGQLPPPMGGQNAMVLELLENLCATGLVEVEHLAFRFTLDTQSARKGQFGKLIELGRVIARLVKIRLGGKIDLLVFPSGGPQTVPLFRDLLLLPWILLLSRRVVLQFHAAGLADTVGKGGLLARLVAWLCGFCQDAVVMTEFNRRDPVVCGIQKIHVVPHTFIDYFNRSEVNRGGSKVRLLAMGHLCEDKGTRNLIQAVAALSAEFPDVILELAGEPLAPYSHEMLGRDIDQAGMGDRVILLGLVSGEAKRRVFGGADIFVFPSVAPYESFGLVMVEAMMWGLPVVASDWRGNVDVLAGSTGAVIFQPPQSVAALTQCLREILSAPQKWPEMGRANRQVFFSSYRAGRGEQSLADLLIKLATQDPKAQV
jgi:glycosyltransferase involved in cell wall biosynthesis